MSATWAIVELTGVATVAIKALGPVFLGGRELPPRITGTVQLLGPALLAALVVTQVLGSGERLIFDARLAGLLFAALLLWRRAPILLVLIAAAAATAIARALG